MLPEHYAPNTPLRLLDRDELIASFANASEPVAVLCFTQIEGLAIADGYQVVLSETGDLNAAAAGLYDAIRRLDATDAREILAERLPQREIGVAMNDRLERASAKSK